MVEVGVNIPVKHVSDFIKFCNENNLSYKNCQLYELVIGAPEDIEKMYIELLRYNKKLSFKKFIKTV